MNGNDLDGDLPENVLGEALRDVHRTEEEAVAKRLARKLGFPYLNLMAVTVNSADLQIIPREETEKSGVACIYMGGKHLKLVCVDPLAPLVEIVLDFLKRKGFSYDLFVVSKSSFQKVLDLYLEEVDRGSVVGKLDISVERLKELRKQVSNLEDFRKVAEHFLVKTITEVMEVIVATALEMQVSDLHFEVKEDHAQLRFRVDGVLMDVVSLDLKTYKQIVSRTKVLAGMALNIKDRAQDGRFTIDLDQYKEVEIRVSVIPSAYGEDIVLRTLSPELLISLENLGFREDLMDIIMEVIKRPNGMVIITGPTGSGKTSSLYAFVRILADEETKVITLEDPIEYRLPEVAQTQINPEIGYTFANGLRAILRHDPDVILVGEIRDGETAKTAMQASLTGHLVFSTLHTNDAAGSIPRFIELGVAPHILSSALSLAMAQRLVRRVCPDCAEETLITPEELEIFKRNLDPIIEKVKIAPVDEKTTLMRAKGCPKCNGTGYKGRVAVAELIQIDKQMEKMINSSPGHADVLELAKKAGFIGMFQDGLIKIINKKTTLEEVERMVGGEYTS